MASRIPTMYGRYYVLNVVWRGREYTANVFRSKLQKLQRPQAQKIADSIYPGSRVVSYHESDATDKTVFMTSESKKPSKKKKPQVNDEDKVDAGNLPPAMGGVWGEEAPPGREKQVKALKKKVGKDKAYAFAWAQHNKKGKK